MNDILTRLRSIQNDCAQYVAGSDIMREAADEIERQEQRIRELESWIPQAYKEGYQDAQNELLDESEGFESDWEVSMAKMVFDEKLEQR